MMDSYEELGLPKDASADMIRDAYRQLVKRYHPDRHRDNPLLELAQEKMQRINRAYAMLSGIVSEAEVAAMHDRAMELMRQGEWGRARQELTEGLLRFPQDVQLTQDLKRVETLLGAGIGRKIKRK